MFGLIATFKKLFRNLFGLVNDAADQVGDAGREARQILREYENKISEAENSLVDVEATYEILLDKKTKAEAEVNKWVTSAKAAVAKGDDVLARDCLNAKSGAAQQLVLIQTQLDIIEPQVTTLNARIDELKQEAQKMSYNVDSIQVRSDIAKATSKAATVISGIGSGSLTSEMQSLNDRVDKDEARSKVLMKKADASGNKSLEARVDQLTAVTSIEDELAALKAGN